VIVDEYKKELAAAKQYLRQSMVISLTDKPSASDAKNSEDKEKFEWVNAELGYSSNTIALLSNYYIFCGDLFPLFHEHCICCSVQFPSFREVTAHLQILLIDLYHQLFMVCCNRQLIRHPPSV